MLVCTLEFIGVLAHFKSCDKQLCSVISNSVYGHKAAKVRMW